MSPLSQAKLLTSESILFQFLWSPFSMLHWGSVCTGSWGLGGLGAKNCFSAGQCGALLISAKARCAAMNKGLPEGQRNTSHSWQIQIFKIYFYSPWKWVIMATLRWTQPISVQFYREQEQHREHFCVELQGRAPAFLGWKMRQVMVRSISLLAQSPGLQLIQQRHFGQQAYLCTQYPSHPYHHIPTPQ